MTAPDAGADPGLAARLGHPNLVAMFLATAADRAGKVAVTDNHGRMTLSYDALRDAAGRVAAGLTALGIGAGDAVALMMTNRPEFFVADLGALYIRAIPVSLYNSATAAQLVHVLGDAGCRVALCEQSFRPVLEESRRLGAPLERIVVVDGEASEGAMTLAELEAAGAPGFNVAEAARAIRPDDIATLIYTSGSTGLPKGVEITHAHLMAEVRAIAAAVPHIADGSYISLLPAAHIGDRARSYYGSVLAFGHSVTTVADTAELVAAMKAARPLYFGSPPRIWEKIRAGVEARHGADVAERARRDPAVGATIRAELGLDRVRWISTGSAPTQPDQFPFFEALGIRLCELWGMTETCSIATTNTPDAFRFGSVGRAVAGVELRVADDGELLVRGPTVVTSYRNRPRETAEARDAEGWFHTGDLATIDDDGYLWITGRKKDIIINAAGKNMSPSNIESALKAGGSVIMQACAIGDRRPYNVALIVVDAGAASEPDATLRPRVQAAVDAANAQLSRVEQIKRFAILRDEWLAGGDELTPTMKLRRREIEEKYARVIDHLYAAPDTRAA